MDRREDAAMSTDASPSGNVNRLGVMGGCAAMALLFLSAASLSQAETRGYAIQLVHTATSPTAQDCPKGGNGGNFDIQKRILMSRGYTDAQATDFITKAGEGGAGNPQQAQKGPRFNFAKRGTIDGKPVDVSDFPLSEPDPQIETVQGHYAYGFNLTGQPTASSFEDPETHEMVENQMWRVLGCFTVYQVKLPVIPYNEGIAWDTAEDAMPAWLLSVSGPDLSKDGDVTVTFDRSFDIAVRNTHGGILSGSSYTVDPDPRNHSVFKGHLKDGVLTIEPGDFSMQGESQFYAVLRFKQTHLRLKMEPDGTLQGFIGGYQPWQDYYRYLAIRGEGTGQVDMPGVYYAMKRLADGVPDPATGQNTAISAAYYIEAVPAFVTPAAKVVAAVTPSARSSEHPKAPTTPEGITVVEVMRELSASQPQYLWDRPGDADGRTLLTSDKDAAGSSSCLDACAQEFPPLLASRGAKAFGDWSLIARADGAHQWAYQSHALYTWSKEKDPGQVATNVALTETANLKLAENAVKAGSLLPPAGWQVARFNPAASLALPDGLDARMVSSAQGVALTDVNGMTLYVFDGDARQDGQSCATNGCRDLWQPVAAPALAMAHGDFSVVARSDGSKQWAYRKHPLYLYSGDTLPGDARGSSVDKHWSVAQVYENFRPQGVGIATLNGYGDTLTLNGMTLYGGYPFEKRWGGRNLRGTFTNIYFKGKQLGSAACVDESCLQTWRPFLASADAKANGFWEPVQRPDGTRQWAYKGYALYTYAGDKVPGDHSGQAIYDFAKTEGTPAELKRTMFFDDFGRAAGGAGVYWNIAKP
jgi:predicted lipoprotein with Yx(FWY)xxD motif